VERAEASGEKVPGGQTTTTQRTPVLPLPLPLQLQLNCNQVGDSGNREQRSRSSIQHPASSIQPARGILTSGVRPHTSQSGKRCRCRRRISKSLGGAMATYSLHECASTHFANAFTPPLPPTDRQRSSRPGRRSRRVLLYRRQMCCMLPCAAQSYPGPALVVVDQMEVAPG
jgi:hypothetical protein